MILFKPHLDHKHIDKSVRGKRNRLCVGTELALDELLLQGNSANTFHTNFPLEIIVGAFRLPSVFFFLDMSQCLSVFPLKGIRLNRRNNSHTRYTYIGSLCFLVDWQKRSRGL